MLTELTFLRPIWFFALIPAILLLGFLWLKTSEKSSWHQLINPKYHPYLLGASSNKNHLGIYFLALAWLIAILALTGPSLHKQPLEAQKTQTGSVIVLDLSLSMLADDLKPNRLTRVHFLLKDLIKNHPELTLGMVGYSGTAHIISPIAEDNSTLNNLISHLNPLIMPSYGADAVAAFQLANQLLENSQITQGHIIWITDDLEEDELPQIKNIIQNNNLSLSLVAVGTEAGAPIKIPQEGLLKNAQGQIINAKPPLTRLEKLATNLNASYQQLTQTTPTYSKLLPKSFAEQLAKEETKESFQAIDSGIYLLIPLLLLAVFGLRKGWLGIIILGVIPLTQLYPTEAYATDSKPEIKFNDRWKQIYLSDDQRGYQAWEKGDYLAAEREFENQQWQAAALYKQGKYQQALELFKKDSSAQGLYNQGNSYAQLGKLEEALEAYEAALAKDPNLTSAKTNKKIIEDLLKENQPEEAESSQNENNNSETNPKTHPEITPEEQQEPKPATEENSDEENSEQGEAGKNNSSTKEINEQETPGNPEINKLDETKNEENNEAETSQQPTIIGEQDATEEEQEAYKEAEASQALENWLNQIEDNPGIFLQRKFDYQYQNRLNQPAKKNQKLW